MLGQMPLGWIEREKVQTTPVGPFRGLGLDPPLRLFQEGSRRTDEDMAPTQDETRVLGALYSMFQRPFTLSMHCVGHLVHAAVHGGSKHGLPGAMHPIR